MNLLGIAFAALTVLPLASTQTTPTPMTTTVSFDCTYDNPQGDLHTVACSDGQNGLLTKGFMNFSMVPAFPNIGGAPAVAGFNSPACGSCWNLTYAPTGNTISVTAIDVATRGFNIALAAMNTLTNNAAVDLGRVNATAVQVDPSVCRLAQPTPAQRKATVGCPASFHFKSPPE